MNIDNQQTKLLLSLFGPPTKNGKEHKNNSEGPKNKSDNLLMRVRKPRHLQCRGWQPLTENLLKPTKTYKHLKNIFIFLQEF